MHVDGRGVRSLRGAFLGRDVELARVVELIAAPSGPVERAVVIRGEAGIGKTRLLDRAIDAVTSRGWNVLSIHADELTRVVPYGAFLQALASALLPGAGRAADSAGELVRILTAPTTSVGAVHGAATRLLAALREHTPIVLAVDDLPLLDDDSIVLLAALLRRPGRRPLTFTATLRSAEVPPVGPLAHLLDELDRDRELTDLELGPLSDDAVAELAQTVFHSRPDPALIELVQRQSDGNPFFAVQSLFDLSESGLVEVTGDECTLTGEGATLSPLRREALLRRVLRVDPTVRRLAHALALVGSADLSRVALAAELAAVPLRQAEAAFDLLVALGVVRVDGANGYRFAHQLVRDALYQELGPTERRRWHRRAATWLSTTPSPVAVEIEVGRHVRESAQFGDSSAIDLLARVAERACRAAPHTSIDWYRSALALVAEGSAQHAELSARLARALLLAGRFRDAAQVGRAVLADVRPQSPVRSRLASLVVEALTKESALDEAAELIDAELAAGTGGLRLQAQAAYVYALAGRTLAAERHAEVAEAELGTASPAERVDALVRLLHMRSLASGCRASSPLLSQLEGAALEAGPAAKLNAYAAGSVRLAVRGETERCETWMARARELLVESGWDLYAPEVVMADVLNAANVGEWDAALTQIAAHAGDMSEAGSISQLGVLRYVQSELLANRGEWPAALRAIGEQPSHPTLAAIHALGLSEIDFTKGDLDAARARLASHLDSVTLSAVRTSLAVRLADVEAEAGRKDSTLAVIEKLRPEVDELDHPSRVRLRLAEARATGDVGVLREILAVAGRHRLALLGARASLTLGTMGVEPDRTLTDAIRAFQRLGAAPWRRRVAAELRKRGLPVPRRRRASAARLSDTEAQIGRLVQLGKSNRAIADVLSLSVKTVDAYLSRVYAKTGCSSRLELARALDAGLLD